MLQPDPEPLDNPAHICLRAALTALGIHADPFSGISGFDPFSPEQDDFERAMADLGLGARYGRLDLAGVQASPCPVLLRLHDGRLCTFLPFGGPRGEGVFWSPDGVHLCAEDLRSCFTGEALMVSSLHKTESSDSGRGIRFRVRDLLHTHRQRFFDLALASLFINLFVLLVPLYTMNIYDRVVPNMAEATLFVLTGGILLAIVFDFCLKILRAYILDRIGADQTLQSDRSLMFRLIQVPERQVVLSPGKLSNLFREIQNAQGFFAGRLFPALIDAPFAALFLFVIYLLCPPLVLVPLIGAGFVFALNFMGGAALRRISQTEYECAQGKQDRLLEFLEGLPALRMLRDRSVPMTAWSEASRQSADILRKGRFFSAFLASSSGLIMQTVYVLVIFFGVYEIHANLLTVGGLIAISILSSRAMAPLVSLAGAFAHLKYFLIVLDAADRIFRLPHSGRRDARLSPKGPFQGRITLENVSFSYPKQAHPVIRDLSLSFSAGEAVGILGRSGAGKSTLGGLLAGRLEALEGQIRLDGVMLESIPSAELRQAVVHVPQDPRFFTGTLRDNLLITPSDPPSKGALDFAVHASGLDLVFADSGLGLDMDVGPQGGALSAGQKQSLALARAFLCDPRVLILDEPAAGMDHHLEARVRDALQDFVRGRTFFLITHRSGFLPLVGRVIILEKGGIVADGPREKILPSMSEGGAS